MFDQIALLSPEIRSYILRFIFGAFGIITYFVITMTGFIKTEIDNPSRNPNLYKIQVMLFFVFLGGSLALMFEIGNSLGCFVQGLTIRPTLTYLYQGVKK
jgi:hypothetical protein